VTGPSRRSRNSGVDPLVHSAAAHPTELHHDSGSIHRNRPGSPAPEVQALVDQLLGGPPFARSLKPSVTQSLGRRPAHREPERRDPVEDGQTFHAVDVQCGDRSSAARPRASRRGRGSKTGGRPRTANGTGGGHITVSSGSPAVGTLVRAAPDADPSSAVLGLPSRCAGTPAPQFHSVSLRKRDLREGRAVGSCSAAARFVLSHAARPLASAKTISRSVSIT
jgi:hypothetical protein